MNSPAVDYTTTETAPQKLWKEWLTGYFDGGSHDIGPSGSGAVTFPQATVAFDQAAFDQPLATGLNILVMTQTISSRYFQTEAGKEVTTQMRWNFYIRSASVPAGAGTPELQCRLATEKLKAILMNDFATKPLQARGLMDIEVEESEPVQSTSYILRRLKVTGRMEYEMPTQ